MSEKNWIQPPLSNAPAPVLTIGAVSLFIVADMRESAGFLQVVEGDSALHPATPSCRLQRGQMLLLMPAEIAEQLRAAMAAEIERARLAGPSGNGGPR